MVSERLGKHNSIKCISFSACTLLKLNSAALQLCGLTSQPQARREGSQGLGQKCTYHFFPPSRLVPENLKIQIIFTSAV